MRQRTFPVIALAVTIYFWAAVAPAADLANTGTDYSSAGVPWLLGDWDGARTRLKAGGVDFQLGYVGEIAGNATGGFRRQAAYADQWVAGVTLDLGRLGLLRDGSVQVTFTDRNGRNLSDDAGLGTLQEVQEIYGRGRTARLTRFWYNQKFADGLLEWKIGRMPFSEDFSAFSCDFQNLTFCGTPAGNIISNYIYNWPISQWATRLKINLGFGYFQFAAFDQNPKYLGVQQALLPAFFSESTGVLLPVEFAWLPKFGDLQGGYKLGGWYDTSSALDVVTDIAGGPAVVTGLPFVQSRGRYGAYVNFLQQITRNSVVNPRGGLSLFLNVTVADRRTALTDAQVAGGLVYSGLFRPRPDDDIGFAVGMTQVNSRVAWSETLQNLAGLGPVPVRNSEYIVEAYYTYRPLGGLEIRPNVQYVVDPGGMSQNRNALVFGLKTVANF
ncbi:carbohydrate porin [Bradyrhizobium sp. 164]|uniref:carbohydrate porin n=1 Tax=Bradyrhizobium sp. 164 TaxID=2782637 RepID=UPI001FF7546C|nr:carbohydrate porin [Bradyrhizobium sp. 164]MCK1595033.1 carbohydrate porin [Bradyrhizobium sp. 164]